MSRTPTADKVDYETRHLAARLTRWCAPLAKHLVQRSCPFLLTRSGEFVDSRRRRIASSPHGRLHGKKSCVLPDEISMLGGSKPHSA